MKAIYNGVTYKMLHKVPTGKNIRKANPDAEYMIQLVRENGNKIFYGYMTSEGRIWGIN